MMSVQSSATPTSLLGATEPELTLRVCSGAQRGQLVRLTDAKCTIGSAPSCTLRLQGEQIAPWHCVVLRGQQRTIIRRLSAATRLNNAAFHDAELVSGDRLTVGNVEFEVLAGPHSLRPRIRPEDQQRFDTLEQRRQLANQLGRDRLRRLIRRLRKAERRLAESEQRRRQYEHDVRELEERHSQLVIQREQLDAALVDLRRREAAAAELAQQSQLQTQQHERSLCELRIALDQSRLESAQQQTHWDSQRAEWEASRADLQQQIIALEQERTQLVAQQAAWSNVQQQQLDELRQLEQTLAAREAKFLADSQLRQSALDELERSLTARHTAVEAQQQSLAAERTAVTQLRAQIEQDHAAEQARWQAEAAAREAELTQRHDEQQRRFEQQHSDLLGRTSALESLRVQLDAEREQLAVQAATLALRAQEATVAADSGEALAIQETLLADQQAQLTAAWAELAQQQAALTSAQQAWDEQRQTALGAIEAQRADVELAQESLAQQLEQFHNDSALTRQRHEETSSELARQRDELDRRVAELAERGEELLLLQQRIEQEQARLAECNQESSTDSATERPQTALSAEVESQRAAILAEMQQAHQALVEQQAAMDAEREQIITEKAQWRREHEAWQREVAEEAERRTAAAAELARQEEELRQQLANHAQHEPSHVDTNESFEERAQRIRNELLAQAEALRSESIEVTHPAEEPASAIEMEQAPTEPEVDTPQASPEPESQLIRSHERESAAEVMRRMGLLSDLNAEDPTESTPAKPGTSSSVQQSSPESVSGSRQRPAPEPVEDEDEDMNAYMAQLLQRVGGRKSDAVEKSSPATRPDTTPVREPVVSKSEPEPAPEPPQPLLDPREMTPRSLPPELSANLSAMRAIANRNARDAVTTHLITKTAGSRNGRIYVISTSVIATLVLSWCYFFQDKEWALMPMALSAVTLMVWLLMAHRETRRLQGLNQKKQQESPSH